MPLTPPETAMDQVVQLVYSYGYRNNYYQNLGQDVVTDLRYVCGYCRSDISNEGYFVSTTPASPEYDDYSNVEDLSWLSTSEDNSTWNETTIICEISSRIDDVLFTRYVLIPAALIILLLSFFLRRRSVAPQCCSGRPGLIFPVNMIDYQKHRFPYVAAFTLSGWHMLYAIFDGPPFYPEETAPSENLFPNPPWIVLPSTKAFFVAVGCIQYAFVYYPVFAALSSHHIIGYIAGTLYTWMLASIFTMDDSLCPKGKGKAEIILNYISVAPPLLCLLYLVIAFPFRVIQELCSKRVAAKTHPYPETMSMAEARYVKDLFLRHKQPPPPTEIALIQRIKNKIYVQTPGFKYSVSVLTGAALGICFTFMTFVLFLQAFYFLWGYVELALKPAVLAVKHGNTLNDPKLILLRLTLDNMDPVNQTCLSWVKRAIIWLDTLEGCYYAALVLAFVNIVICVLLGVKNYKANMLMIYQGRHHDVPPACDYKPQSLLLAAAKYVGFQTAYATWGFVLQFLLLLMIFAAFSAFFNLLCPDHAITIIIKIVQYFWVTIVVLLVIFLAQYLMGRFLFMLKNDKGDMVLALDNRRLFFNFNYFTTYSNTALGIVSCAVRILKSFILGLYIVPRLDMSTLNRHYEWFDASFMSFVGLLYLENAHRNPVMLVAAGFMLERTAQTRRETDAALTLANGEKPKKFPRQQSSRYKIHRNRWLLALTLCNNPGLRLHRKKALVEDVPAVVADDHDVEYVRVMYSYERQDMGVGLRPPVVW